MTNPANKTVPFMAFWKALNEAMKDRGQAPVLFGEARTLWAIAVEQDETDRDSSLVGRIKRLVA